MNTPVDDCTVSDDALQKQARVWLRLLTSDDVKAIDAQGFQRWLRLSAAHKAAFAEVRHRWEVLEPASREMLRRHPQVARAHEQVLHGKRNSRRAFLGVAAGAAAAAVGVMVVHPPFDLWAAPAEWGADARTATGEQRTLAFAGRVSVTLNTQTSIRRNPVAVDGATAIDLLTGETAVDMTGRGAPFAVIAGAGRSVTQSGRFTVRYLDNKVCVTCIEGTVRIAHPAGTRTLSASQQTFYDRATVSGIAGIETDAVTAWRRGALMFDQVRLADAIGEINRYRPGRVVLMPTAARNELVSGRFLLSSLDAALAQLQQMFHLSARSLPGGLLILG